MPPPILSPSGPQYHWPADTVIVWIAQARDINDAKLLAAFAAGAQKRTRSHHLGAGRTVRRRRRRQGPAARAADLWRFTRRGPSTSRRSRSSVPPGQTPIEKVLANWAVGTDPGTSGGAVQAVLDASAVPFLHLDIDLTAIDCRTNVTLELCAEAARPHLRCLLYQRCRCDAAPEAVPTVWDFETDHNASPSWIGLKNSWPRNSNRAIWLALSL